MPDPFRSREDLPKAQKGGGVGQLVICECLRTYTHKKKLSSLDTSDSLTVNWGGENASPSSLSRLPPNQKTILF